MLRWRFQARDPTLAASAILAILVMAGRYEIASPRRVAALEQDTCLSESLLSWTSCGLAFEPRIECMASLAAGWGRVEEATQAVATK